jgi:hypothetical protein
MKKDHRKEYKYNYEEIKREMKYFITHLKLIVNELSGDPERFVRRTIKDCERVIKETEENLKDQDASS